VKSSKKRSHVQVLSVAPLLQSRDDLKEMENCTFCKIIARKIPGHIIDEDDSLIVFLSLEHHPLIVPKQHLRDIFALKMKRRR